MTVISSKDGHVIANIGRGTLPKRHVCLWIIFASLPFLLGRLYISYISPLVSFPEGIVEPRAIVGDHSNETLREGPVTPNGESSQEPYAQPHIVDNSTQAVQSVSAEGAPQTTRPTVNGRPLEIQKFITEEEEMEAEIESQEDLGEDDEPPNETGDSNKTIASAGTCDLYDGAWIHDSLGPLYTNSTCYYIQSEQNCQTNGRPDNGYLYWRWKPKSCDLERFNGHSFLHSWRGKTLGFIGDSLARNQMQSLLCMLSQVERPTQTLQQDEDHRVRWFFPSYSFTLAALWAPYLLKESLEVGYGYAKGISKLHLDVLDDSWTSTFPDFDVVLLSVGQWFYKTSVYIEADKVVGCHYCPSMNLTEIGFYRPYRSALRLALGKVLSTPSFKGTVLLSTFALDHFENGRWDNGGNCSKTVPLDNPGAQLESMNGEMYKVVLDEFEIAMKDHNFTSDKVQLKLLDVTKLSLLRPDGHPGPYRQIGNVTGHVQNDCLHWCLPGPVDTWNQFVVKILGTPI